MSYATWYAHPRRDYFAGNYTDVCRAYGAAPGGNPIQPDVLLNNLASGTDYFGALVMLGDDDRIVVLHRVRRHQLPPGIPATPFDGQTFATLNDVSDLGPVTVTVPADIFHRTQHLVVRTAESIDGALAAEPGIQLTLPLAGDLDVSDVRTRNGMFIPPPTSLRYSRQPVPRAV
jgi:hypothetical protein